MSLINCVVVTPEATVLETKAQFIALPLFDGELGIAPNRSPMIGRLGYGELRLQTESGTEYYYIDGGFVQVADNVVTLLTNRTLKPSEIERDAVETQLAEAKKMSVATDDGLQQREKLVAQAQGQKRVAQRGS